MPLSIFIWLWKSWTESSLSGNSFVQNVMEISPSCFNILTGAGKDKNLRYSWFQQVPDALFLFIRLPGVLVSSNTYSVVLGRDSGVLTRSHMAENENLYQGCHSTENSAVKHAQQPLVWQSGLCSLGSDAGGQHFVSTFWLYPHSPQRRNKRYRETQGDTAGSWQAWDPISFTSDFLCYVAECIWSQFFGLQELPVLKGATVAEEVKPCCWNSHPRAGAFRASLGICTGVLRWSLRNGRRTEHCCFS